MTISLMPISSHFAWGPGPRPADPAAPRPAAVPTDGWHSRGRFGEMADGNGAAVAPDLLP